MKSKAKKVVLICCLAVIWSLWAVFAVELDYVPLFLALRLCLWLVLFATSMVLLIIALVKSKQQFLIVSISIFCALACEIVAGRLVLDRQREGSIEQGRVIIEALERYHSDRGSYPATLEELIPEYLDNIPETQIGFLWHPPFWYSEGRDGSYCLTIPLPAVVRCQYHQKTGKWIVDG